MGSRGTRVLVVDDSPQLRDLLVLLLDDEEDIHVVGQAADGAEAVELVELLEPDVVLLDIAMPVMDGLEALRLLRLVAPATRVILLSGYAPSAFRADAIAEADDYLEKGVAVTELVARVRALCPEARRGR
jgi:DNA-binding NarL/FixJ family response regulator